MNKIDKTYYNLVKDIYENGFDYEDPNRKGVNRRQIPYFNLEHDFKDGFPIIGVKQSFPKMAFNEMKAFMSGVNTLKGLEDLGVSFWRKDAYNYFLKSNPKLTVCKGFGDCYDRPFEKNKESDFNHFLGMCLNGDDIGDLGKIYPYQIRSWEDNFDQLNSVLERLKREPNSTKNIITMWNPNDLEESALSPCHTRFSFLVENLKPKPIVFDEIGRMPADIVFRENKYKYGLRIQWNQDSVDTFLGLPMNIMYYSFICHVFAYYLGMKPLGIIGNLTNVHLYDNSFDKVEELLSRDYSQLKQSEVLFNLPKSWDSLDDYLDKLNYKENINIYQYEHLGRLDVEMLAYNK